MRRRTITVLPLALAMAAVLWIATPVAAFPLANCSLDLSSASANGQPLDDVHGGTTDATQDDPFLVDWSGSVTYRGAAQVEMKDYDWHIDIFGIPTPVRGSDTNADDDREADGTVDVGARAPFRITGLYYVSGSIAGSGGTCEGSGWFKVTGDPVGTTPFFIGLLITILGAAMLIRGSRGYAISAIFGGFLTGIGVAMLLVLFGVLPLGWPTPLIVVVLGIIAGVAVALYVRGPGRGPETPFAGSNPPPNRLSPI